MAFSMASLGLALPQGSAARRGRVACKAVAAPAVRLRAFDGFHASGILSMGSAGEAPLRGPLFRQRRRPVACATAPAAFGHRRTVFFSSAAVY